MKRKTAGMRGSAAAEIPLSSDSHSGRAGGIMVAGPSKGHDRNPISQKPSTPTSTSTCTSTMTMTSTWTLTCHVLVDGLLKASKYQA
jgi:hypothetical protein